MESSDTPNQAVSNAIAKEACIKSTAMYIPFRVQAKGPPVAILETLWKLGPVPTRSNSRRQALAKERPIPTPTARKRIRIVSDWIGVGTKRQRLLLNFQRRNASRIERSSANGGNMGISPPINPTLNRCGASSA
ncbi:expressed unknown protein [Seminavis robusta]|uniref:Uncharacterized protein n=1 Tax=Seminavis robusta TaxID=568900 RepID=A0A9N8E9F5_9STRA|nr:expressed unknown protein [Seminavis robusta]|eukprot:Sro840_g209341.1  (134) ;mRNA; r:2762-3163